MIPQHLKKHYGYSLKILGMKPYTENMLKDKLYLRGLETKDVELIIDKIKDDGYSLDNDYIFSFTKSYGQKGYSSYWISMKLKAKKLAVSIDYINDIFFDLDINPSQQIQELISKKRKRLNINEDESFDLKNDYHLKTKIINFVLSKGHSLANVENILQNYY